MQEPGQTRRIIHFGVFQVDLSSGELLKHGIKIRLQEQPFQILAMLLERPGEVVTREELRRKLWPSDTFVDFDVGLNSAVLRLRSALSDSAENPRYVETLPRRGYRFIGAVDGAGAPAVSAPEVAAPAAPLAVTERRPFGWTFLVAGALVILAAAFLLTNVGGWRQRLWRISAPAPIRSIAVLPLENLTGDPSQEYFVDGMTDALITDLAQISTLQVTSRTSVVRYKKERKPLAMIARELGVDAVVEGTVVRSGNRVRIDAQLIQAASDRHLWARSYEGEMRDILALQDGVAREIAAEIQVKLTPEERARLTSVRPVNPEAYDAYLRGRFFVNKKTVAWINKSIEYFNQAIEKDPGFALPYAGLAYAYITAGFYGGLPPKKAYSQATEAAKKALEIDDTLAEAHTALGSIKFWFDWDWEGAEKEYKRAIELNPRYALAHRHYSFYLASRDRLEESLAESKRALELDPLSLAENTAFGWILAVTGQTDAAIEHNRKALEMDPHFAPLHRDLCLAYAAKGMLGEAVAECRKATEDAPADQFMLASLGYVYGVARKKIQAREILGELLRLSTSARYFRQEAKSQYVSPWYVATVYTGLGEKDQAFAWLEKAYAERSSQLTWLNVYPVLTSLWSDPRFADLARRVGLPPVNHSGQPAEKTPK